MTDISEVLNVLQQQGDNINEWKSSIDDRLLNIEARAGRPSRGAGPDTEVKTWRTPGGQEVKVLAPEQKAADLTHDADPDGWTLADFTRAAVLGSRDVKLASGTALVPQRLGSQLIDLVRAKTVLVEAGAQTILVDGPTTLAKLTGDPTVHQHTEGATDISESDITLAGVTASPKLLAALVPLTVELVRDSSNLDQVLNTALAAAFAAKIDTLGIATLLANASIPASASAQDPAGWAGVLAAVGSALAANQELPRAIVGASADFITRAGQLDSTGSWLGKPPVLANTQEFYTTGITAGTAFMGDFGAGLGLVLRSSLSVEVVRHAKPTSAQHLLVAHAAADFVVLQPARLFKALKTIA